MYYIRNTIKINYLYFCYKELKIKNGKIYYYMYLLLYHIPLLLSKE